MSKQEVRLHRVMCVFGGFIGAYALLIRFQFGSAQTLNMIMTVLTGLSGGGPEMVLRIVWLLLYIGAIVCYVILSRRTTWNMRYYTLAVNAIGILILYGLPADIDPLLGLYPVAFMMASQWCVFHGVGPYNSSTIFSTNNLKQTVLATVSYCLDHDPAQKEKACFFAHSLLWFHIGVTYGWLVCTVWDAAAILAGLPCLLLAAIWILRQKEA